MINLTISERTVNVQELIHEKGPEVYKKIPKFVFGWLRRILHEKKMNEYLWKERDKAGIDFATAILEDFGCEVTMTGAEKIKPESRYIFCANHPLGAIDGMAFISRIGRIRPDVVFPVNDVLLGLPPLAPIFLPISKLQKNTANRRHLDEAFKSDRTLLYFPAGLCSRKQKGGVIRDLEWKKTFITQARKTERNVIPVHISGKNSNFFYNLARLRVRLGIKANLEQVFLVDEMFKQRSKKICLSLGEPIPWQTFDKRHTDKEWAALVREHVYKLASDSETKFEF